VGEAEYMGVAAEGRDGGVGEWRGGENTGGGRQAIGRRGGKSKEEG